MGCWGMKRMNDFTKPDKTITKVKTKQKYFNGFWSRNSPSTTVLGEMCKAIGKIGVTAREADQAFKNVAILWPKNEKRKG